MFTQNISAFERFLRVTIGLVTLWVFAIGFGGIFLWLGLAAGLLFIVTGILGYCQLYSLLGINTKSSSSD